VKRSDLDESKQPTDSEEAAEDDISQYRNQADTI
jgi:hypothetical protein